MKLSFLTFVLLTAHKVLAEKNIMNSLYLADRPDSDDEFSMIGEFGFLLENGNTNTSTVTAKLNTNKALTSWSYQFLGDALYKQSQQELVGETNDGPPPHNDYFNQPNWTTN